jgi:tripartite-type tricarboxylate transporter receptor subunit TctC
MNLSRRDVLALGAAATTVFAAQAKPNGPVTLVVPFPPGGIGDALMRTLGEHLRAAQGVAVLVENRAGAAGTLGTERIARAAPDGTVVGLYSPSTVWIVPQLQRTGYDPLTQLTPLGQLVTQPMPVYVRADSRYARWQDVLDQLRTAPGGFSWGTAGSRSMAEIMVEAAFRHLGLQSTSVPFRGGAEAITALLGGHVDAVASTDFGPLLRQGAVRLLVETGPTPADGHAVPTFTELGYPLSAPVAYGVVGPAGLSPELVSWWDEALYDAATSPAMADLAQRFFSTIAPLRAQPLAASFRAAHAAFGAALRM